MYKIYGASDDIVEIENLEKNEYKGVDCFEKDVRIKFADGTQIRVGYSKKEGAIWWIRLEKRGSEPNNLIICHDEEAPIYSDVFLIDSDITSIDVIEKEGKEVQFL